jgi:hypothetical protein
MTRVRTGSESVLRGLNTAVFTYPTPRESLISETALPTSEPASGSRQVSYTLQASDFPVLPAGFTCEYYGMVYAGGRNSGASSYQVATKPYRNGTAGTQIGLTSVAANNYWCASNVAGPTGTSWAVGDTIQLACWGNNAAMRIDWYGIAVFPTKIKINKNYVVLKDVYISSFSEYPTFSSANMYNSSTGAIVMYHNYFYEQISGPPASATYPILMPHPTMGQYRSTYGDYNANSPTIQVNATQRRYYNNAMISTMAFRYVIL